MSEDTNRRAATPAAGNHNRKYVLSFEQPIAQMEQELARLEHAEVSSGRDTSDIAASIRSNLEQALRDAYSNLSPWETVQVARHPQRPLLRDYIRLICKDFCELSGDHLYGNDKSMVCGFTRLAGQRVMLVGQHKGRDTREKIECNFGCSHPEGYRKALHKMKLAAKFKVPIVCLIDTPGAYPGVESEERGIASAIAVNLMEMSRLPVPIIACVIGEGGSGGALGIAVADQIAVMEYAYYSVISPEGCAAILWKSGEHAAKAADALRLTPRQLRKLNLVDHVLPEPLGGAHRDAQTAAANLEAWIAQSLRDLRRLKIETILKRRYDRLRKLGSFFTDASQPRPKTRKQPQRPRAVARAEA